MSKVARPRRVIEYRYFLDGQQVGAEEFWDAAGGSAPPAVRYPRPPEPEPTGGYVLTEKGRAALDAADAEAEARHQAARDRDREPGRWPTGRAGR